MNIVYAFIIIDLICLRCTETDKHYCKCIIHRSIMYCLFYYGTKSFIVYMNTVYAFIIIDVICVRCIYIKGALYRIWCGVNRLGDNGVIVV